MNKQKITAILKEANLDDLVDLITLAAVKIYKQRTKLTADQELTLETTEARLQAIRHNEKL